MNDPLVPVTHYAYRLPFKPSSKQLLAYLEFKNYPIPKHRDTKEPTTEDEAISRLITQFPDDPVLPRALTCRHISKGIGYLYDTYLGKDGRMHPRYGFVPRTGRLSSKAPNLMNLPQGRKGDIMKLVADAIRETVIPSPGYELGEIDWDSIEALLLGYFADDPDYMRLAKLGVHSYVCSHKVGKPADMSLSDEALKAYFKEIEAAYAYERALCKKMIYAGSYGQGIFNLARDMGCSVADARKYRQVYVEACPKVDAWKKKVTIQAHEEGELSNPFGYRMSFFEALKKVNGKWRPGKEYTELLAFKPQSTCAAMLRKVLVDLGSHPEEGTTFRLLIPTHDSVSFEFLPDRRDYVMQLITDSMERPWKELGGMSISTSAVIGHSLKKKEMHPWP